MRPDPAAATRPASDGRPRALTWLPDVMVLDLMLPRLDGIELFRRLRQAKGLPEVRSGAISVRNRPGGCEFTVQLPAEVAR